MKTKIYKKIKFCECGIRVFTEVTEEEFRHLKSSEYDTETIEGDITISKIYVPFTCKICLEEMEN